MCDSERRTEGRLYDHIVQRPRARHTSSTRPHSRVRAVPHISILKMDDVSIPQRARPGPPYRRPGRAL